jgi:hypothetical protein
MQKHPFLIEIETSLGRDLTAEEALAALAGLYLKQRDELRSACESALEWLGEKREGNWPYDQAVNNLIDQLETAIKKAQ